MMTVEQIMGSVEDRIIDLRGCSRDTARTYMAGYLRNKEQARIAAAEAMLAAERNMVMARESQANWEALRAGWCRCAKQDVEDEAYYMDDATGEHGWMCVKCKRIRQTG